MKKYIIILIITSAVSKASAQHISIGSDLRSRFENRHGYGTLIADTMQAANFVTQRNRIVIDYVSQKIKIRVSPQNVKVWGDVTSTSKNDLYLGFHEAYGQAILNEHFSFKIGRQEINYDDARIFGNVDWSMQARSHDAFIFKMNPDSNNTLHIGLALNANKETNFYDNYVLQQYKTMQYFWYHGNYNHVGLSFLALNNGMAYIRNSKEKIAFSQTIGPRINFKNKIIKLDASSYLQIGRIGLNNVNAFYFSANAYLQIVKTFNTSVGFEYLSGKANNDSSSTIKSFNPLYGTNHKFNGYMDYFYVGNHTNSVGLTDIYANFHFEKNKISLKFSPHYFASAANIYKGTLKQNNFLGTELDCTFGYQLMENVKLDVGYSQIFASSSMETLKGGNKLNMNNWVYVSISLNPKLLSIKNEIKK